MRHIITIVLLAAAGTARAQCPQLSVVPGCGYNGVYPSAERMVLWDPDGDGPRSEVVLISGVEIAGERACNGFAMWDGTNLEPLPGNWTEKTGALLIWNGRPLCNTSPRVFGGTPSPNAGVFEYVNGDWRRVGTAADSIEPGVLALYGGSPIATRRTGQYTAECIRWDGSQWVDFNPASTTDGWKLVTFGEQLWRWSGGEAHRWTGAGWEPVIDTYPEAISGLASDGARLLIHSMNRMNGFNFSRAGVSSDGISWRTVYNRIDSGWAMTGAALCGADVVISRGLNCTFSCFDTASIISAELASPPTTLFGGAVASGILFRGERLVGGALRSIDSSPAAGLLAVRDDSWQPLFPGIAGEVRFISIDGSRICVSIEHESGTMDTSTVRSNATGVWAQLGAPLQFGQTPSVFQHGGIEYMSALYLDETGVRVKRWTGQLWEPVSLFGASSVSKIGVRDGQAVVTSIDGVFLFDGTNRILLAPLDPSGTHRFVGGSLYALAGGQVRRFEAGVWRNLGAPFNAPPASLVAANGELIAVGGFASNGGTAMAFASRWDGTAWRPLGSGAAPAAQSAFVGAAATANDAYVLFRFSQQNGPTEYRLHRADAFGGLQHVSTFTADSIRKLVDADDAIYILGEGLKDGRGGGGWLLRYGPGPNPCPADLDCTGAIDGDDIIAFFAAWESGASSADMNGDADVDADDVTDFFVRWDAGC